MVSDMLFAQITQNSPNQFPGRIQKLTQELCSERYPNSFLLWKPAKFNHVGTARPCQLDAGPEKWQWLFILLYRGNSVWIWLNHWSLDSQTSCLATLLIYPLISWTSTINTWKQTISKMSKCFRDVRTVFELTVPPISSCFCLRFAVIKSYLPARKLCDPRK